MTDRHEYMTTSQTLEYIKIGFDTQGIRLKLGKQG